MTTCEHCGYKTQITMVMVHQGEEWYLCARCWRDGVTTKVVTETEPVPLPVSNKPAVSGSGKPAETGKSKRRSPPPGP